MSADFSLEENLILSVICLESSNKFIKGKMLDNMIAQGIISETHVYDFLHAIIDVNGGYILYKTARCKCSPVAIIVLFEYISIENISKEWLISFMKQSDDNTFTLIGRERFSEIVDKISIENIPKEKLLFSGNKEHMDYVLSCEDTTIDSLIDMCDRIPRYKIEIMSNQLEELIISKCEDKFGVKKILLFLISGGFNAKINEHLLNLIVSDEKNVKGINQFLFMTSYSYHNPHLKNVYYSLASKICSNYGYYSQSLSAEDSVLLITCILYDVHCYSFTDLKEMAENLVEFLPEKMVKYAKYNLKNYIYKIHMRNGGSGETITDHFNVDQLIEFLESTDEDNLSELSELKPFRF